MIEKVWVIWVTGVLQPSLPQDILVDLGLTERPAMVTRALDLLVQLDLADRVQAPGTPLIDVFDRLDRALLMLGAPGAGKTTLLLTLTRDLLQRAAQDPEQPIPVVFPLSSWAAQRRPLAVWLVDELQQRYGVHRKLGQAWIDADQVLPLLDGLDEVQSEHRTACAEAINTFQQDHGLLPLAVCSRITEYDALGVQLRLQGAIVVQPLTHAQVDSYLAQVGPPLTEVREALQEDSTLWELLDTPLMLTVVTLAYAGQPAETLRTWGTLAERRQSLFATYVHRMFQRRSAATRYTRPQTERWLAGLAWQLTQHGETSFSLERLQPDWLPVGRRWLPTQSARLLAGLVGLLAGLSAGLLAGLGTEQLGTRQAPGLGFGLILGLIAMFIGGLTRYSREITPIETVRWSWSKFLSELLLPSRRSLHGGLVFGLGLGLVDGQGDDWRRALGFGLNIGLIFGLIYKLGTGLAAGLSGGEITTKTVPNEGIHRSARIAVSSGVIAGLIAGLVSGLIAGLSFGLAAGLITGLEFGLVYGLSGGLFIGLAIGLKYGGRACLQHLALRLSLRYHDCIPRRYVDFLDYAAERLFLRRVGGGYIFIHRLLQEYFASLYTKLGSDSWHYTRRRPWIAGCLSCTAAGIGQLYNGQPVKALVLYGLGWGVWPSALMLLLELSTPPWNIVIPALMAVSWYGYILLDAILTARMQRHAYRVKAYNRWYVYLLLLVATAVVMPLTVPMLVVQEYRVTAIGMEDTLLEGDLFWMNKFAYRWHGPARGDIIVFPLPRDPSWPFVKRVIGLPGDHVEVRNHRAYVNGEPLNEPYVKLNEQAALHPSRYSHWGPEMVPPGHLFVLGDNRANSEDSRDWGAVDSEQVKGRVCVVFWSRLEGIQWRRIAKVLYSEPIPK